MIPGRRFSPFFPFIFCLIFAVVGFAQPAPLAGFDAYAEKAMRDWEVPGMAIAVVKDDKIVFARGYGVKRIGDTAPVDERTIFAIGSSSKAFTAAALAILVDEGKIKWDDPVSLYLPDLQLYDPYASRELRIRDLLTHRSGLERGDLLWYGTSLSREEILRRVRYLRPTWSLRSQFGYQNLMYLAAGEVVHKVSGMSWDEFTKKRIFDPLGMSSSSTSIKSFKPGDNISTPHGKMGDKVEPIAWRDIDNIGPAGSINSNVIDVAKWVRLQLNNGTYEGKKIFSPAVAAEMHVPQTIIRLDGPYPLLYPKANFFSYGLGWFLSDFKGRKLVEHGGAIDGMRAEVAMVPSEKLGIIILTNMNGSIISMPLVYRIIDAYIGEPQTDYNADLLKGYQPLLAQGQAAEKRAEAERITGTSPSHPLDDYVGIYQNELYGDVKIEKENGQLKINYGPYVSALEHWHFNTFRATFVTSGISRTAATFALNAQGKVDSLSLGLAGMASYPFKKQATPPAATAQRPSN
ncbi:MAG TPA: serine hydrolase [Pyrinomonadaceae bacterium]|nr:serine hydrolase [Pyrinomonadaceae bacterium]